MAYMGYEIGMFAPGVRNFGKGAYNAGHTMLKAHAESWHIYNDEFRSEQQGELIQHCKYKTWFNMFHFIHHTLRNYDVPLKILMKHTDVVVCEFLESCMTKIR